MYKSGGKCALKLPQKTRSRLIHRLCTESHGRQSKAQKPISLQGYCSPPSLICARLRLEKLCRTLMGPVGIFRVLPIMWRHCRRRGYTSELQARRSLLPPPSSVIFKRTFASSSIISQVVLVDL